MYNSSPGSGVAVHLDLTLNCTALSVTSAAICTAQCSKQYIQYTVYTVLENRPTG